MDPKLFEREIERAIARYCFSLPSDMKDDLRQDCRLRILQLDEGTVGEQAAGYVFRCCRNMILTQIKSDRSKNTNSLSDPAVASEVDGITELADGPSREEQLDLTRSVEKLPVIDQAILRLSFGLSTGGPLSDSAVGKALGITTTRARRRREAALEKLRALMGASPC
ncbi:MAG: sigma factor-like helix-turn-helix DNA-binding protein [Candidatus Acidiferrales bacterium]